jgi:hypothetical protein
MITSRKKSVTNIEMTFAILLLRLGILQKLPSATHVERICGWISSEDPKYFEIGCFLHLGEAWRPTMF